MTVTVIREYRFEAAHHLPWHPGKCAAVHGHSYRLEVAVAGDLDERGVVMDFAEIDAQVRERVLAKLDHHDINSVLDNPTCERIAQFVGAELVAALPMAWLRLWETDRGSVMLGADDLA